MILKQQNIIQHNINMGNSITQETRDEMQHFINSINSTNCPTIDLGTKNGSTGYLDFIKPEDTNENNVVKGIDQFGRKFIVIKSTFILSDNGIIESFCTFFQRYSDNSLTWHCCGHYGFNMMSTEGGMNLEQFEFLDELLQSGEIELNEDINDKCRLKIQQYIKYEYKPNNLNESTIIDESTILSGSANNQTQSITAVKLVIGWHRLNQM